MPVRSTDGFTLHKDTQQILDRWDEHFNTLLNAENPSSQDIPTDFLNISLVHHLDSPPSFTEVHKAIKCLKKKNNVLAPRESLLKYLNMVDTSSPVDYTI